MSRLAVVVIHYHLRPGGVTRVIERAVESLGGRVDLLVLTGEAPSPADVLTPVTEPFQPLEYAEALPDNTDSLISDLRFTARSLLGRDPDVWHIHNHALGKNGFTPRLVWHLAQAGCRLLLQPHDFAEDGRPDNYRLLKNLLADELDEILYPAADHIRYAPINCRDKRFLEGIGLPNVHELPNAVTPSVPTSPATQDRPEDTPRTVVYPARAIRRKNIGEFLLWSLLAPEGVMFQSTLAPQNPAWRGYYNDWVAFAEELGLPVEFDVGRKQDFAGLIQNAEALMTTSIAEGFGLAFLEPWLEGKTLIGRKLPEITADFEKDGLDLSTLYSALPVPLAWAGEAEIYDALRVAMIASYADYSKPWESRYFDQAVEVLVTDGKVDFGILDEPLQRNVIQHLAAHPEDRDKLPSITPSPAPSLIDHNRQVVINRYGLEAYGERLLGIYEQLAATEPGPVHSAAAADLLDEFLKPERFNLLRT